ncbi:MAG: polyprenyl synthetase family protein [Acidobacteria bacterium]|nr:polyprenyl synthetase family protein [Acidobacteriota bacterium]
MRYSALGGGKRLRPLLVLAACRACGGDEEQALPAALAVEMIHAYSLVHDDLPAMDDDELRRGRPTTHVAFGEALAILAGDALQSRAFEMLARARPAERVAAQLAVLARAAGAPGMAGGQALDLLAEGRDVDEAGVEAIHRLKTGALLTACFRLGALAAGAPAPVVETLTAAGREIGLAFQIQDDVLDVTASTAELGKTAGKDQRASKATWPAVVGLDESRRRATELLASALARLAPLGPTAHPLVRLARQSVERAS